MAWTRMQSSWMVMVAWWCVIVCSVSLAILKPVDVEAVSVAACPAPVGDAGVHSEMFGPSVSYLMSAAEYTIKAKVIRVGLLLDIGEQCRFLEMGSGAARAVKSSPYAAEVEIECLYSGNAPPLPAPSEDAKADAAQTAVLGAFSMQLPATRIFINGFGTPGCAGGDTDIVIGEHYLFFLQADGHEKFGSQCSKVRTRCDATVRVHTHSLHSTDIYMLPLFLCAFRLLCAARARARAYTRIHTHSHESKMSDAGTQTAQETLME